jgi:putative ABC transport system permease protein
VVNETFVRRFDLGADAIGKRIRLGPDRTLEIVGVFADAKYTSVKDDIGPQFFIPRHQFPNLDGVSFYVRGAIDAAALLDLVPRAVAAVDPNVAVSRLMTMRTQIDDDLYADRLVTLLASGFAVLATLLAAIGLYGVLAYNVRQRTRELGLRLALGANPARLRTAVLKQVACMAAIGLTIGIVGAALLGRTAETLLFGLSGYDPAVLGITAVVIGAVVCAAGFLPARSASRVAPMEALRYE